MGGDPCVGRVLLRRLRAHGRLPRHDGAGVLRADCHRVEHSRLHSRRALQRRRRRCLLGCARLPRLRAAIPARDVNVGVRLN